MTAAVRPVLSVVVYMRRVVLPGSEPTPGSVSPTPSVSGSDRTSVPSCVGRVAGGS